MGTVKADQRGRVSLGKEVISKYGEKFDVVPLSDKLVLVPVPHDPVKDLRRIARQTGMGKLSPAQFRKEATRLAEAEAVTGWAKARIRRGRS
jgi:hypothetical protein